MSEEKPREVHMPDAIAHSVVPPEPETAATSEPQAAPPETPQPEAAAAPADALAVEDGPFALRVDEYFPLAWLAALTVVSVIGVYNAVSRLPQF